MAHGEGERCEHCPGGFNSETHSWVHFDGCPVLAYQMRGLADSGAPLADELAAAAAERERQLATEVQRAVAIMRKPASYDRLMEETAYIEENE